MKKLVIGIITVSLAIIALTGLYSVWTNYRRTKEAEVALANMEANKPERYKAEVPPAGPRGSDSPDVIVVWVDGQGGLKLNSQEAGTISDTTQLRAKLEQIFQERGDRYPDRTVFVKAYNKVKYPEVKKIIDAAKDAGADPVGLELDELR